jgi:hypothetical protein
MWVTSAPPRRERIPFGASELVIRLAVVLGVASVITFAAMAVIDLDSGWMLVPLGEALLSLALLSQT